MTDLSSTGTLNFDISNKNLHGRFGLLHSTRPDTVHKIQYKNNQKVQHDHRVQHDLTRF